MDLIADSMPLKRFEKIKRFLHFVDNDKIPDDNKDFFIKVRPVIEALNETFQTCMSPPEFLAVDEAIIPFKGRSRAKQYLKKKPKKWGFKSWVLAASNGYVCKFEMYQGKRQESTSDMGVISDTVLRLCSHISGKNHKLFLDNLFTNYKLLKILKGKGIEVVGVFRSDRLYGADASLEEPKQFGKMKRGSMNVVTSEDNITIVQWKDTGIVYVGSTFAGIQPTDLVRRWDKTEKNMSW
ncbi:piggyBac transposable element-derived protein 2-like [Homalodisca vitripennis]|uniref:piggyBac transposable element-derived protein 2-like n=1 Tax=Homalodisca vitripennis TaxID=197043 RepID=UPI001EEB48F3|nr:piggyBac transposable element-derived protein 2-like [Homalodisca vitripennis]